MNIIAKVVKETILIPYRVVQGMVAAGDEVIDDVSHPKKEPKK